VSPFFYVSLNGRVIHYWMGDAHHCSGPPSPKWPILCRVGR